MVIPSEDQWRCLVADRMQSARKAQFTTTEEAAIALFQNRPPVKSRISMWETAMRVPTTYVFIDIGRVYKKHPAFLAGLTDDLVYPTEQVKPSSGRELIGVHRGQFEKRNIKPDNLVYIEMPDSGMTGDIEQGEVVIVDQNEQHIIFNKIYAISNGGSLLVRRIIESEKEGHVTIQSNNNDDIYPSITILKDDLASKILGMAINVLRNI